MKTITRADVAETIYEEVGLSRKDSTDILDMILDEIVQELVRGKDVKLLLSCLHLVPLCSVQRKKEPAVIRRPVLPLLSRRAALFHSSPLKQ